MSDYNRHVGAPRHGNVYQQQPLRANASPSYNGMPGGAHDYGTRSRSGPSSAFSGADDDRLRQVRERSAMENAARAQLENDRRMYERDRQLSATRYQERVVQAQERERLAVQQQQRIAAQERERAAQHQERLAAQERERFVAQERQRFAAQELQRQAEERERARRRALEQRQLEEAQLAVALEESKKSIYRGRGAPSAANPPLLSKVCHVAAASRFLVVLFSFQKFPSQFARTDIVITLTALHGAAALLEPFPKSWRELAGGSPSSLTV